MRLPSILLLPLQDASTFYRLHPFHFVIDRQSRVLQVSVSEHVLVSVFVCVCVCV